MEKNLGKNLPYKEAAAFILHEYFFPNFQKDLGHSNSHVPPARQCPMGTLAKNNQSILYKITLGHHGKKTHGYLARAPNVHWNNGYPRAYRRYFFHMRHVLNNIFAGTQYGMVHGKPCIRPIGGQGIYTNSRDIARQQKLGCL
jgi:hypothetical protein